MSPYFVSREKTLSYENAGLVGFAAEKRNFQVTCPAGRAAVGHFLRPDPEFEICHGSRCLLE